MSPLVQQLVRKYAEESVSVREAFSHFSSLAKRFLASLPKEVSHGIRSETVHSGHDGTMQIQVGDYYATIVGKNPGLFSMTVRYGKYTYFEELGIQDASAKKLFFQLQKVLAFLKDLALERLLREKKKLEEPSSNIRTSLKSMKLGPAGSVRKVMEESANEWTVEPQYPQRLDHYGNDGNGWEEDSWNEKYANPTADAANAWLEQKFGKDLFSVEVGEKGSVHITLTLKGQKELR